MTNEALPAAEPEAPVWKPVQAIMTIAATLRRKDFGPGPLASLRRQDPSVVLNQPAFHRLVMAFPDNELASPQSRIRWATVIHAMAIGAQPGVAVESQKAGVAMAKANLSEARFAKLLAARDESFRDQVVLVSRHLHAKDHSLNWRDLGELILVEDRFEDRAAALRFRIAQDYYKTLFDLDKKST